MARAFATNTKLTSGNTAKTQVEIQQNPDYVAKENILTATVLKHALRERRQYVQIRSIESFCTTYMLL